MPLTQIFSILAIPVFVTVGFLYLGKGRMHGYVALIGGAIFLVAISLFKGALELAWGHVFSQPTACSVREFYEMSGGLGCSPIPVAATYSFVIYGLANLVFFYVRKAS